MHTLRLFYRRFMDDFIVLTTTRRKLKRAVKAVNQRLDALKLEKHPDKTFIGRIDIKPPCYRADVAEVTDLMGFTVQHI